MPKGKYKRKQRVKRIEKMCIGCNTTFKVLPCHSTKKYCSHKCFISSGGFRHTQKHSKESIELISRSRTGKCIGKEHPNFGKDLSSDIKVKISNTLKKYFSDDKNRKKTSEFTRLGMTEEVKEKIRKARLKQILPTKDTSIEIKMQNILKLNKIKFEKHKSILGQPDIFIEPNICIFCDGDYWHNYPVGRDKDRRITKELRKQGYIVLRFWERDINNQINKCYDKIVYTKSKRK